MYFIEGMICDISPDWGNNETVSSIEALHKATEKKIWKKGHIILEGNNFDISKEEVFSGEDVQSDDEQKPVVIRAKDIGGVTIKGNGSLVFKRPKNLILCGIKFEYKTNKRSAMLFEEAKNCRITRCDFKINSTEDRFTYLTLKGGDSNCIAYNKFHDKEGTTGQFLMLSGVGDKEDIKGCTRTVIEYNHFKNLTEVSDFSGGEAVFIGGSEVARVPFKSIVRYNLFENCRGDPECITNKSCCNVYHHNTFRGNKGSLSLRHGLGNIVDSNIFLPYTQGDNNGLSENGIRLYGNKQRIVNNYFKCKRLSESDLLRPLVIGNGNWPHDPTPDELEELSKKDPDKRLCLDPSSSDNSYNHAAYAQVKDSHFEKNIFIVDGENNDDDRTIVIWGNIQSKKIKVDHREIECPRGFRPKSSEFRENIIIAKSGTMFKIGDGATIDDNIFKSNKLHKEDGGSADRGNMPDDGISHDAPTTEERAPRDALEESDVGPFSERSDQGHCSREELSSLEGDMCS
jgi:Chondroitinase B